MRYVTVATDALLDRLTTSIMALVNVNTEALTDKRTGEIVALPRSPAEAWDANDEAPVEPLGFIRVYYQKVSNPNADDYQPRRIVPVETYGSKAGHTLFRAYDYGAGFVKSFRLDAVQRIGIGNQNLSDDEWGATDISFRVNEDQELAYYKDEPTSPPVGSRFDKSGHLSPSGTYEDLDELSDAKYVADHDDFYEDYGDGDDG